MKQPLAILLLLFSFVSAQQTIAVIEFEAKGISQIEASALSDELEMHLTNIGGYTLVERGKVEEVLQEQGFQQTGCTSDECAVEVGMLLSVQNIVIGSISKVGSTYSVNAKIVDVETGEIIKTASYKFRGLIDDLLVSGMAEVASELMGKGVQRTEVVSSTPPPPRKRVGSIYINTQPQNAQVKIDGNLYRLSPTTVEDLSPGNHLVEVSKDGFVTSSKTVEVMTDEMTNVDFDLYTIPRLTINSEPSGALIKINGKDAGKTPISSVELPSGYYRVSLLIPLYEDFTESFLLEPGDTLDITANLIRKVGAIDLTSIQPSSFTLTGQDGVVAYQGTTPSLLEKADIGKYELMLESDGFISVKKNITVSHRDTLITNIKMDSIEEITDEMKSLKARSMRMFLLAAVTGVIGGVSYYSSEQAYAEYSNGSKDAVSLRRTFETLDIVAPVTGGIGGVFGTNAFITYTKSQYYQSILDQGFFLDKSQ